MGFTHTFVDRPIFASVISILIVLIGAISYTLLPVAQYPEIAPPTIVVSASYPGPDAGTVARTVATPIEEQVNGVDNMLYMSSYSGADGSMSLTVTFALGTDLDDAQVLVQNRVAIAEPQLPEEVRTLGVTTLKSSPDLMMVVHMLSPDNTFDQLYVSNYARSNIVDVMLRLDGVGNLQLFGERRFSMRIWLDPNLLAGYQMTAADVVEALQEQNVQVSGGALGAPPAPRDNAFEFTVTTEGRFSDRRDFRYVIVKSTDEGRLVHLQDVARIELGAQDYTTNSYLNNDPAVALGFFQRPGTNALEAAAEIQSTMARLSEDFPPGLAYEIVYNPTEFISDSIDEVYITLFQALALVVLVMIVFLQSWRTAIIPVIAIPVSLIGTFAVLFALGMSLNLLTLFGLVLAIGIVVDDAIVVVENVERNIEAGMAPRAASHKTMDEVAGAVISTSLVLIAVFVPTAFVPGITGQFYYQFAITISVATAISSINSLTLSPALAAILLKPIDSETKPGLLGRLVGFFAGGFNAVFDLITKGYAGLVRVLIKGWIPRLLMLVVFAGLLFGTVHMMRSTPQGFIPPMDQGYAIVVAKLPDGASLSRTDAVTRRISEIILETPGAANAVGIAGLSGSTFTTATDAATLFVPFKPFKERLAQGLTADVIVADLFGRLQSIQEAFIIAVAPPPVQGIGNSGGFRLQLQDRQTATMDRVLAAAFRIMGEAAQTPGVQGVFTTFSNNSPQYFLEVDRDKARMLNVPISNIFDALAINLGSAYVNDFNAFGRNYQVRAQADADFRLSQEDILRLKVESDAGALVPLGTLVSIRDEAGPALVQRYNMFVSVPVQGEASPGVSTGEALATMERLADEALPPGTSYAWTDLAFQESQAGNEAVIIFALSVLIAFLVLAANYESWVLPFAIMLIVPLSVFAALVGVTLRGLDNNILTQVGLIVLVGLAAKNAILIVEFAKQLENRGLSLVDATVEACRLRLRPILMTAFAFILGVIPLLVAVGPGAEMRIAIGTAVFAGMLGVTSFGLFLTPVFYVALRAMQGAGRAKAPDAEVAPAE